MADEQALARVRLWWNTLDPATQMMFDKLYRTDPANVLAVISDGSLTDINGAANLSEALDYAAGQIPAGEPDPFSDRQQVPVILVADGVVIAEPVSPAAGEQVTVRWTEENTGAASSGHLSTVAWFVGGQWAGDVQELVCGPMQPGERATRTLTLPGVQAGEHSIYVSANADGNLDGSGPVTEKGMGMMSGVNVVVGGGDRPDSPQSANFQGITQAGTYLSSAYAAAGDFVSVSYAAQAMYSFAGSLDTGGVAREGGNDSIVQDDQASVNVVRRAQALEALSEAAFANQQGWQQELEVALQAVGAASADPWSGGQPAYEAIMQVGTSLGIR